MVVAVVRCHQNGEVVVVEALAPQEQMAHQLKLAQAAQASVHQLQDHL
jgi:hypothetical protein